MHGGVRNSEVTMLVKKSRRIEQQVTQLSEGSMSNIVKFEIEEEDDANTEEVDENSIRHIYHNESYREDNFTYNSKPIDFIDRGRTTNFFYALPILLLLFELFWPNTSNC